MHGNLRKLKGTMKLRTERLAKASGKTRVQLDGRLGALKQSAVPQYRIADARFALDASHSHRADVRIARLAMSNPAAGTSMEMSGGLQLPGAEHATAGGDADLLPRVSGRRSLALVGTVVQDLAPLAAADDRITASGRVTVPFKVESGDFAVVRTRARVRMQDVAVGVPALEVSASGINGEVPILEDIALRDGGIHLLGGGRDNAYARWRFADQHPFIGGDHFVSVRKISVRGNSFGPLAGNAEIDRNVMHVDQLEMSVLGGKVTGQCIVNVDGRDTDMLFRGNITGVKAPGSRGRLDANAAIEFRPGRLALIGRAEVLRLGRAHLRGMLDLWDPYREDDRANKLRLALVAGFPKSMRLRFTHGFADFAVALGGLGNLVRIDEIKGIALGPAMTRYVAPFIDKVEKLLDGRVQ